MDFITPAQCRMARAGLRWTTIELARRAGINPNTITRFENEKAGQLRIVLALKKAFEEAGVVFLRQAESEGVLLPISSRGSDA